MELGEKLKKARVEAGLSQRQLCGEEITRNMLSQIENGSARPSMATLTYLAARLGKPVSWFVDDNAEAQEDLHTACIALEQAARALEEGREIYAAKLLETVTDPSEDIQRRRLLLMARLPGMDLRRICARLPSLDEELLLRARGALEMGELGRCEHLLEAAEDHEDPFWNLLRGQLLLANGVYLDAKECFHRVEQIFPAETVPLLEQCYRELGDYQMAYLYACRQKK